MLNKVLEFINKREPFTLDDLYGKTFWGRPATFREFVTPNIEAVCEAAHYVKRDWGGVYTYYPAEQAQQIEEESVTVGQSLTNIIAKLWS